LLKHIAGALRATCELLFQEALRARPVLDRLWLELLAGLLARLPARRLAGLGGKLARSIADGRPLAKGARRGDPARFWKFQTATATLAGAGPVTLRVSSGPPLRLL